MQPLGIKIDDQLKQRLKAIASRDDRSMSSVVRRAIEKGLPFFEQGVIHPKKILDKVSSTHWHATKQIRQISPKSLREHVRQTYHCRLRCVPSFTRGDMGIPRKRESDLGKDAYVQDDIRKTSEQKRGGEDVWETSRVGCERSCEAELVRTAGW